MSRRTDKKKFKRMLQAQPAQNTAETAAAETSSQTTADTAGENTAAAVERTGAEAVSAAADCPLFIQYQNHEYTAENIISQVREKCAKEGMDSSDLRIYAKPEDQRAYFVCAGGNSFIDL